RWFYEVPSRPRWLREPDDVPERQVLGDVVVHEVEVVAVSPPLALELLGHVGHDVVLLRVHGHDAAMLRHLREDAPEVPVRYADRAEGREDLEARDARLDRLADLADRLRRDLARQDVVEREVRVGVGREAGAPPLDALGAGDARGVGGWGQ